MSPNDKRFPAFNSVQGQYLCLRTAQSLSDGAGDCGRLGSRHLNVRLGSEADVKRVCCHVRFVPSADIGHSSVAIVPRGHRGCDNPTLEPSAPQDSGYFFRPHPAQLGSPPPIDILIKFAEQAMKPEGFSSSAPC